MPAEGRTTRPAVVAGRFYPGDRSACSEAAEKLVRPNEPAVVARAWRGGIVPHAGWICSGAIAGETIGTIAASRRRAGLQDPDVIVVFGAVHTNLSLDHAALGTFDAWEVPAGRSDVPVELSEELQADAQGMFGFDNRFHLHEHSVEVELPLIQQAWPKAALLPIEVPLIEAGPQIGAATARAIERTGLDAVYLASSDLTHYGPAYGLSPAGVGLEGLKWARDNDRRLLEVVKELRTDRIVPEVREHFSACGGGSIAAMLAACRERGTVEARVLTQTNSFEVLQEKHPQDPDHAVGYASVVVG
jgi:AmmeMemoRadiSam system protein B